MYLEKLEIQGFKSFANHNVLVFPGMLSDQRRGLTTIVGPNGSGKSNVADAVRWALGEQSMKSLRGKKSDDVIFSGSDKKSKLSLAEVSLFLNNEDGQAPIDYSQVVLTRRLYRDGQSEYLLNNSRIRLLDVQMLLAKANFGQKTYSVIGQGMVDGFLNTSLAERKEFFDEATGVKQYQIKRDDSLNKLRHSLENLQQAELLLNEIRPRLNSLTKQVGRLQKREALETELNDCQLKYYSYQWQEINNQFNHYNQQFLDLEKEQRIKEKKLAVLNKDLAAFQTAKSLDQEFAELQQQLASWQDKKNSLQSALAKLEARLEMKLEQSGQVDLAWLSSRQAELEREIAKIDSEIKQLAVWVEQTTVKLNKANQHKEQLSAQQADLTEQVAASETSWQQQLSKVLQELDGVLSLPDFNDVKTGLEQIKKKLQKIIDSANQQATEDQSGKILQLTEDKENLLAQINDLHLQIGSWQARQNFLTDRRAQIKQEQSAMAAKFEQSQKKIDDQDIKAEKAKLLTEQQSIDQKITALKEQISRFNAQQEEKNSQLFAAQKEARDLQQEINQLNNRLNEFKISSTRYETKLEDLEGEIRQNYNCLKDIKEYKVEPLDLPETAGRIQKLKAQLDLIGGIDPAIEKEYQETKERYDFLSDQVVDLNQTIKSLEDIIKELDVTIKEKFDAEFKIITQKFEEYFKILFNGGTAKIIKVMADELADQEEESADESAGQAVGNLKRIKFLQKHNATGLAGIEIQATPPGKKIKSIAVLSGGERALVAIALICAIISANPSPFVVLDEVDAALDEANSERLAKILDDLSYKTQFIVITHNRASMRRASILYGVTMQEDGVSKLLSVKLEEIKKDS